MSLSKCRHKCRRRGYGKPEAENKSLDGLAKEANKQTNPYAVVVAL